MANDPLAQLSAIYPADSAVSITPDNANNLPNYPRGIYVGVSGNLTVDMAQGGTNITFSNLAAGVIHPLRVKRIYVTGTTATGIVAVY